MQAVIIRCAKCGKWKRFGSWINPTMEQYIAACRKMKDSSLVFHDSLCDRHDKKK